MLTPQMWRGILLVGGVVAVGTLGGLDASLPGGLIAGTGSLPHARSAHEGLDHADVLSALLLNVWNARSDTRSARGMFRNRWLWGAVALPLALHGLAVHVPFLQRASGTVPLGLADWLPCVAVASLVLWARGLAQLVVSARRTLRR